jgi:hypothetical protein
MWRPGRVKTEFVQNLKKVTQHIPGLRTQPKPDFQQELKHVQEHRFPLPEVPRNKQEILGHTYNNEQGWQVWHKHRDLTLNWYFKNRDLLDRKKELKREVLKTGPGISTLLAAGALFAYAPCEETASILQFPLLYNLFTVPLRFSFIKEDFRDFRKAKKEKIAAEDELTAFLAEQKRELKLRDDIQ